MASKSMHLDECVPPPFVPGPGSHTRLEITPKILYLANYDS